MSNKVWIGDESITETPCTKITVQMNNEQQDVKYDGKSTLLDSLLENGIDAPYSCQSGSCMACLGKVIKGRVYMDDPYILSEENLNEGECLTCQAYPATDEVLISYDDV